MFHSSLYWYLHHELVSIGKCQRPNFSHLRRSLHFNGEGHRNTYVLQEDWEIDEGAFTWASERVSGCRKLCQLLGHKFLAGRGMLFNAVQCRR